MPPVAKSPSSKDPVAVRAGVIASNDATSPGGQALTPPVVLPLTPVSVGVLLREGREKLSLSAGDIATKLRMGLKQVLSLENSEFAALPTGTFLRGFVRNYAKAVALNADDVLDLLEKTHIGAAAVNASSVVVPSQQNIKVPVPGGELSTSKGRAFVIGVVILLLLAAVWYWWEYVYPHRDEGGRANTGATQSIALPQAEPATTLIASAPSSSSSASSSSFSASSTAAIATVDGATQKPTETIAPTGVAGDIASRSPSQSGVTAVIFSPLPENAIVTESARTRTAPPAGSATLGFTFSGDSWVEVADSGGKTILSRRFKAGDTEEVFGRAPFSVVIGVAKSTRMAFNGREFDLDPHTRGAVARVTVR